VADEDTRHQASFGRSDGYSFSLSGGPATNENDPETEFEQEPGMDAFIAGFREREREPGTGGRLAPAQRQSDFDSSKVRCSDRVTHGELARRGDP
jgi:hypothetical protein